LKLLRPELLDPNDTQATRARLLREAQAMAQISHPNVVSVFDIGTYEGQVFIAMEYIEGCDLAQWLKLAGRRPAEVIEVFRAAGRGLAAAHRAGLVHRDFKPQNVMIASDGAVKVTDFGLARAELAAGAAPAADALAGAGEPSGPTPRSRPPRPAVEPDSLLDSPLTRTGALVGTPAYMAPEQVRGEAIDARCDQFAFAVALYEALYGDRPFPGTTLTEIFTATAEGRMRPMPKRGGVPRRIRAAIARGLRASPARRFPTMEALLAELAPRSTRRTLIAVAGALLALGGGAAAAAILNPPDRGADLCDGGSAMVAPVWGQGPRERVRAGFLATGVKLAATSFALVARDLDAYAAEWAAGHREACVATRVREEQTEEMMALRMACLERRRAELAATVEILEHVDPGLMDSAYLLPAHLSAVGDCSRAESLATTVPLPRDPVLRDHIGAVRAELARVKALADAQRLDQAQAVLAAVMPAAAGIGWTPLVAEARFMAARLDLTQGRHEEAEKGYHAAAMAAEQGGYDVVRIEATLGLVEASLTRGKVDESLRWASYARAIIERTGSPPGALAILSVQLGDIHKARGDPRSAAAEYERAIGFFTRDRGARNTDVAEVHTRLGALYFRAREFEKSIAEYEKARSLWAELGGEDHPDTIHLVQTMGDVRREQGKYAESLALTERALAGFRAVYGEEHVFTAAAYNSLGMTQHALGRTDEGLANQERAIEVYRRALGPDHPYVASQVGTIAVTLNKAGRYDEAATRMEEALAIALKNGEETDDVITFRNGLGAILTKAKRYDAAIAQHERALATVEKILSPGSAQLADTLTRLGTTYQRKGEPVRAISYLERALAVRRAGSASPWESSWTKLELAKALWDTGAGGRARQLAEEARVEAETAGDSEQVSGTKEWLAAHR
ncbi:MAG TPA: serine/threonine-protein kinase, partial [Candidatus Acidoferrum sp.]|nr:serine/threonine-protein kinase [Candidatus Acidoferrum sp.]